MTNPRRRLGSFRLPKNLELEPEPNSFQNQGELIFLKEANEIISKQKQEIEDFEIRLIAIPESCLSTSADEVMMHINVMDAKPNYDARINIELSDVFESDKSELNAKLFDSSDSVALTVFFEQLLNQNF